ncbi:MAG: hypothetical protein Q4B03_07025 [Lachnospiraceae bacterium]|nr:hypothetical protein [Lachnospiraceae bacterium]
MLEEVLSRVDLIIAVEGSRRISSENLQFLFDKYELSQEDRETVLKSCKAKGIVIFQESTASNRQTQESSTTDRQTQESSTTDRKKQETQESEAEQERKGFFARLFRR